MSTVLPFKAVFPQPSRVSQVATPPYDVMSTDEAAAMAQANPFSFLRVSRSELELPRDTDPYSPTVYARARDNYARIRRELPLFQECEPAYYFYRLIMNGRAQTGLVAALAIDEYDAGTIKKHEKTRKDKEDDRTRHILTLRSQTGPVFLTCRSVAALDRIAAQVTGEEPFMDFTAPDQVRHTIWRVGKAETIIAIRDAFGTVPAVYIADGHHRAASAARVREQLRRDNPHHTGQEEYNFVLGVVFPADQLRILPYNRLVKELNGLTPEQFLTQCRTQYDIQPAAGANPERPGIFHAFLNGRWYRFTCTGATGALSAIDRLDVSLLQNLILAPVLGITDPRTSNRIEFVGGIRGTQVLEDKVNSGACAVAFSMYPTTVDQLMEIADAGGIMPPKSTWFEPKLRDAILIHDI